MRIGQIILLSGISLIIGIPIGFLTQIPMWIVVIISIVLALVSINLIDFLISFFESKKRSHNDGQDIDEEWTHQIIKEAEDYINHAFCMMPSCNKCGSTDIALIVYGLADIDKNIKHMIEMGEIILGGCMVDKDSPKWICNECKHKFGTLG